ncbi:hypothetical protein [Peribacillus muralis]|uniref:hypothetical protein n=1 Tax=Peribacillus muralis TaxID=264697 RepID=UPI00366DA497
MLMDFYYKDSLLIMFPISFWIILMNEGIRKVKPYWLRLSNIKKDVAHESGRHPFLMI